MKKILFLLAVLVGVYATNATVQAQTQCKTKKTSCCVKRTKHHHQKTDCKKVTCTNDHKSKCKYATGNKVKYTAKDAEKCPYLKQQKASDKEVKYTKGDAKKCPYLNRKARCKSKARCYKDKKSCREDRKSSCDNSKKKCKK